MNINSIHADQIASDDSDITRYIVRVVVDSVNYDLDVYVRHDNDNYVEFDTPEDLQEDMTGEDADELFMAVLAAIND